MSWTVGLQIVIFQGYAVSSQASPKSSSFSSTTSPAFDGGTILFGYASQPEKPHAAINMTTATHQSR
ncbi:MAG: hypothetical protein AAB288_15410, partial [Acidobacteriota bacterium]